MRFQFPFDIEAYKPRATIKNNKVAGIDLNKYNIKSLKGFDNVLIFTSRLVSLKGGPNVSALDTYEVVTPTYNNRTKSKNILLTDLELPVWVLSTMTSNYSRQKNQYYINVELLEGSTEMDVLSLAAGLTFTYGYQFLVHTVSTSRGIYHLTLSDAVDTQVSIFTEIQKKAQEINNNYGLSIEVKVNKKETKSSLMPAPIHEWEW